MTTRPALADVGIAPRLLTREQAATYCGLSFSAFTNWVRSGRIPGPIPQTHRWDKRAIDAALDALSCIDDNIEHSALDEWKATRHARTAERNSPS
jgi:predicted DNA-binding transcriptional regulator AlpA